MKILAIDPSLLASGWSVETCQDIKVSGVFLPKAKGVERLFEIRQFFKALLFHHVPDYVFIEGYAYGGRGQDMGEVGGVLRLLFYDHKFKYIEVVPQHLKKFVCGVGNAKKELMLMKCLKRWGVEFTDNNECDAYCLGKFGRELVELGVKEFNKKYDTKISGDKYTIGEEEKK